MAQRTRGLLVLVGVLVLVLIGTLAVGTVIVVRRLDKPDPPAAATKPATPDAVEFRRVLKTSPGGCDNASATPAGSTVCGLDGYNYVLGKVEIDGGNVTEVKAAQSPDNTGWLVNLTLDDQGAAAFGRLTADLATKQPPLNQLAIVVRGQVVSAPTVMSAIPGGELQITGNYTKTDAEKLASRITG
jgi:preprotein translocase subunit SecD